MIVRRLESVHRPRYFRFCNVLHIWTIRAIPTYRVYRLYDTDSMIIDIQAIEMMCDIDIVPSLSESFGHSMVLVCQRHQGSSVR